MHPPNLYSGRSLISANLIGLNWVVLNLIPPISSKLGRLSTASVVSSVNGQVLTYFFLGHFFLLICRNFFFLNV